MMYSEFREYCIFILLNKMTRSTAENFVDWLFPSEYADVYENKLTQGSEFIEYVTRVLTE